MQATSVPTAQTLKPWPFGRGPGWKPHHVVGYAKQLCRIPKFRAWLKAAHPSALKAAAKRIGGPSESELAELALAHLCGASDVTELKSMRTLMDVVEPYCWPEH